MHGSWAELCYLYSVIIQNAQRCYYFRMLHVYVDHRWAEGHAIVTLARPEPLLKIIVTARTAIDA